MMHDHQVEVKSRQPLVELLTPQKCLFVNKLATFSLIQYETACKPLWWVLNAKTEHRFALYCSRHHTKQTLFAH